MKFLNVCQKIVAVVVNCAFIKKLSDLMNSARQFYQRNRDWHDMLSQLN